MAVLGKQQPLARLTALCVFIGFNIRLVWSHGFCMDNNPASLKGTGFSAKSPTTKVQCQLKKAEWCPLITTTKNWTHDKATASSVEYYFYSGCCSGKQGRNLKGTDTWDRVSGLPTCRKGVATADCKRYEWEQKLKNDLGLTGSTNAARGNNVDADYDFQVTPAAESMNSSFQGGWDHSVPDQCICKPGDDGTKCIRKDKDGKCLTMGPRCMKTNKDGTKCIWCKDVICHGDDKAGCCGAGIKVRFGLQFFKLANIDLKSSLMSFQGWVRQDWYDERLSYDYQCYGGLPTIEVQAQSGNLENTRVWIPDIELINHRDPIWGEQMSSRLAIIYSCWNGNPSRGGCGYVWWSRPGVLHALCKYGGLVRFPMDVLTCELEVAAWATPGDIMDIVTLRTGVTWSGGTDQNSMAGITGGSTFQDYSIKTITVRRDIAVYDTLNPGGPFPTLIYTIAFERSNYFYQMKLFIPTITITLVSFLTFWLDPLTGERLNFGVTVILAVIMNDVVATTMMPVTDQTVLMDYISMICLLFAIGSVFETVVVLNLYFRDDKNWLHAFLPVGSYKLYRSTMRFWKNCLKGKSEADEEVKPEGVPETREGLFRLQLYKEIFFSLDKNHSGELELIEVEGFALSVLGDKISPAEACDILDRFDYSGDGRLDFDEFVTFCEQNIHEKDNIDLLTKLLRGFVRSHDREEESITEMWKNRAILVDTLCRFSIPPGFAVSLGRAFSMTEKDLEDQSGEEQRGSQWMMKLSGVFVLVGVAFLYVCFCIYRAYSQPNDAKTPRARMSLIEARSAKEIARAGSAGVPEVAVSNGEQAAADSPVEAIVIAPEASENNEPGEPIPKEPVMDEEFNAVVMNKKGQ